MDPLPAAMSDSRAVHIVGRDADFRQSLTRRLEAGGYSITSYRTCAGFLAVASSALLGCVLLNRDLLENNEALEILAALRANKGGRLPVMIIAPDGMVQTVVAAMKAGVHDILRDDLDDASLFRTIDDAIDRPGPQRLEAQISEAAERVGTLSIREHQVLSGMLAGKLTKVIASDLKISVRTVEVHRSRLMERLGAQSFAAAMRIGVLAGLA